MNHIMLFENFNQDEDIDKIKSIWEVDPYEFRDIIISSANECDIWGNMCINFSLLYPIIVLGRDHYPTNNEDEPSEFKTCYEIDEKGIKKGVYHDQLSRILETNRFLIVIEGWIRINNEDDWDKSESFLDTVNMRLEDSKIPYKMDWPEGMNDSFYINFTKTNETH